MKEISRTDPNVTELVCCSGFTVTETYGADGSWSSTLDDGSGSPSTVTGHVAVRRDSIYFTFDDPAAPVYVASLQVSQGVVTQRHPTQWDFDGDGSDEPAIEEAKFVKQ